MSSPGKGPRGARGPGGRGPSGPDDGVAPFPLELVRAFVNSDDPDEGDALASGDAAARWLAAVGLLPEGEPVELDKAALARLHAVRAALRALLAANKGGNDSARQPATAVDAVAAAVRLRAVAQDDGGLGLAPADGGVASAIGRLLAIVVTATADGTWERLKACRDPSCRWAFYDHSRNRARTWCDMATCGNRAKVRAYRRRRAVVSGRSRR